jgi:hypothetical protein
VRLSTALIEVICLNRGTTFATVLSMLLMRHERQRNAATGVFEVSGIPGCEPRGATSGGAMGSRTESLAAGSGNSQPLGP